MQQPGAGSARVKKAKGQVSEFECVSAGKGRVAQLIISSTFALCVCLQGHPSTASASGSKYPARRKQFYMDVVEWEGSEALLRMRGSPTASTVRVWMLNKEAIMREAAG